MALLDPNRPPPPDYYASRMHRLFDGVERQYSDLLDAAERTVIDSCRTVSTDAQRLLARLWSRTGPVFRVDSLLHYAEIDQPLAALTELTASGLVYGNEGCGADRVLERLSRDEIAQLFPAIGGPRKRETITRICARYPDHYIHARIAATHPWCALACATALTRIQVLFFGGGKDLATFVLEDLGVNAYERYAIDPRYRQFRHRRDFECFIEFAQLRRWLHDLAGCWNSRQAEAVLQVLWPTRADRTLEQRRGRLLLHLGRSAERARAFDIALAAYRRTEQAPARERRVRILTRLDDTQGAQRLLSDIRATSRIATERLFADGFGRRRPRLPEDHLRLTSAPTEGVETAALAVLTSRGGTGRHLENRLSLGMLGLAFWEHVFAPVPGAFVNSYQAAPLDLHWHDFRRVRGAAIDTQLRACHCDDHLRRVVDRTWRTRFGISNSLIHWRAFDDAFVARLLCDVPARDWCRIFDFMLDDLGQARTGFPDLVLLRGGGRYELVEIKGPGDQIRPEQRVWFEFFRRAQLPARVLRVTW